MNTGRSTIAIGWVTLAIIVVVGEVWAADINCGNMTVKTNAVIAGKLRQGLNTVASGYISVAEGWGSMALGDASHAEGAFSEASGWGSHAEGYSTRATNYFGHAEGDHAYALGYGSHAEGGFTIAGALYSHAGGFHARVMSAHSNAFIHATGMGTNNYKKTLFPDTAHFDRLITLAPANNHSNSVLNRAENDLRYATTGAVGYLQSQVGAVIRTNHEGNIDLTGRFHVSGGMGGTRGQVEFQGTTNSTQFFVGPNENIYLRPGRSGGYIAIEQGRLGIGTTNPATKLDVYGIARATLFQGSGALLTDLNGATLTTGSVGATSLKNGAVTIDKLDSAVLNFFAPGNLQAYAGNNLTYSNHQFHVTSAYSGSGCGGSDGLKLTGGTMSGALDMGTNRIAEVADAVDGGDAVNKRVLHQVLSNSFEHVPALGDLSMGWYTNQP